MSLMLLSSAKRVNFSPCKISRTQSLKKRMKKKRHMITVMNKRRRRNSLFVEGGRRSKGIITDLCLLEDIEEEGGKKGGIERSGEDDVKKGVGKRKNEMERGEKNKEKNSL